MSDTELTAEKFSKMVAVNVRGPYSLYPPNENPVAFLWINGDIHDVYPCGRPTKRISWLPMWFPFNCKIDYSLAAQRQCVEVLYQHGLKIQRAQVGK